MELKDSLLCSQEPATGPLSQMNPVYIQYYPSIYA